MTRSPRDFRVSSDLPAAAGDRGHRPDCLAAAHQLHGYLVAAHWTPDGVLAGPDPGIRFNARVGRFAKSYSRRLPWTDDLVYLQAQGYWILDNWLLHDATSQDRYEQLAVRTSESVLGLQHDDGHWAYPNPEWSGRVATVEGCFAALGLLESYARTGRTEFLDGATRWHSYLRGAIGFRSQPRAGMLAVNYFAHSPGNGGGVPNNSTLLLWTAARLAEVTGDQDFLREAPDMLRWLEHVQQPDGELPYAVGAHAGRTRVHFLCYQYNAFEFMDLVHYHRITGDPGALPVLEGLAAYLTGGLVGGTARYDCTHLKPEVAYYATAVARALSQAHGLGMADGSAEVAAAYRRTLAHQEADGSFAFHSRNNYRFLTDRRSYPRYLSMMLHHLLLEGLGPREGTP